MKKEQRQSLAKNSRQHVEQLNSIKQSEKLVQNFLTALNTNYQKNQNQLSRSSTTTSDKENSKTTSFESSNKNILKNQGVGFLCDEQIQNQFVRNTSTKLSQISKNLQKIKINPFYFVKHEGIKSSSRSILLDWIAELCEQFNFSRFTCSLARTLVDVYLSRVSKVHLNRLQLVGITCLLISSKLEESMPKSLIQMAYATACLYNTEQISQLQIEILASINFEVRLPTYNCLIDSVLNQWQTFKELNIDTAEFILSPSQLPYNYLSSNLHSMMDIITLDSQSLNYNSLNLILALHILLLGYAYEWFSYDQIHYSFIYNCRYLVTTPTYFVNKIQIFLNKLNLKLLNLISSIRFVSSFFFLVDIEQIVGTIQVHNSSSLQYLQHRKKFIKEMQLIFQ